VFAAVAFGLLGLLDPYFFCQDNALVLELPSVLMTYRGVWRGLAAEYNPYTFLGSLTQLIGGVYPPL